MTNFSEPLIKIPNSSFRGSIPPRRLNGPEFLTKMWARKK